MHPLFSHSRIALLVLLLLAGCGPRGPSADRCLFNYFEYEGSSNLDNAYLIYLTNIPDGHISSGLYDQTLVPSVLSGNLVPSKCTTAQPGQPDVAGGVTEAWLDLDGDEVDICLSGFYGSDCTPSADDPRGVTNFTRLGGARDTHVTVVIEDP